MANLGQNHKYAGGLDEAMLILEEAFSKSQENLGSEHPVSLICMHILAMFYREAGRLDEALPLLEETLRIKKENLAPEHPDTLTSMCSLAVAYQAKGRLHDALHCLEKALGFKEEARPRTPLHAAIRGIFADGYSLLVDSQAANQLVETQLGLLRKVYGPEHPRTLRTMCLCVKTYRRTGRYEEAMRWRLRCGK